MSNPGSTRQDVKMMIIRSCWFFRLFDYGAAARTSCFGKVLLLGWFETERRSGGSRLRILVSAYDSCRWLQRQSCGQHCAIVSKLVSGRRTVKTDDELCF